MWQNIIITHNQKSKGQQGRAPWWHCKPSAASLSRSRSLHSGPTVKKASRESQSIVFWKSLSGGFRKRVSTASRQSVPLLVAEALRYKIRDLPGLSSYWFCGANPKFHESLIGSFKSLVLRSYFMSGSPQFKPSMVIYMRHETRAKSMLVKCWFKQHKKLVTLIVYTK